MPVRIPWDEYEVALLLRYCIDVEEGRIYRHTAVSTVSAELRKRAQNQGKAIDDIFRNENGISMQMAAIKNCYHGRESGLTISRLFRRIVSMYKNDRPAFERILAAENNGSNPICPKQGEKMLTVDFRNNLSYSHTKPVTCRYKGAEIKCNGWNALFINTVRAIYQDCKATFPVGVSLSSSDRVDTGNSVTMIYPKEIADGIYLECNVNATGVINKLRVIMDLCGIPYESLRIEYKKRGTDESENSPSNKKKRASSPWKPQYTEQIVELISSHYKYGFRLGSPIEMLKLRNYAEAEGLSLPDEDVILEKEIQAAGLLIDGKIRAISQGLLDSVGCLADKVFEEGISVIFLEPYYEINSDFMEENHIASTEMLKAIMRKSRPNFYYGQNIITDGTKKTEHEATIEEIHRVSGDNRIIYYSELVEQLPFVPRDKIAWSLSYADDIVWVSEGTYFRTKYFIISEEDSDAIFCYVDDECDRVGFASITEVPMGSIAEDNYDLSDIALYSSIYNTILKSKFKLNSKILTKDKNDVDIEMLLKAFCNEHEQCTLDEVMSRAEELTGSQCRRHCLNALYRTKVRIDADHFVSDQSVHFDIDHIDQLLSEIVRDGYTPIRSISTFALFPPCGQSWNHFLLESYCYRFSRKYLLSVFHFNDKNAGLIAANGLNMTYLDMLSESVAKAEIPLNDDAVGSYLFDNGYSAKRKGGNLPKILERAKQLREER